MGWNPFCILYLLFWQFSPLQSASVRFKSSTCVLFSNNLVFVPAINFSVWEETGFLNHPSALNIYKMFLISAGLKNEMLKIPQIPLVSLSFLSIFCHQIKMPGQVVCNFCHELSCGFYARIWILIAIVLLGIDFYFLPSILDRGCGVLNTRMCIDIIV